MKYDRSMSIGEFVRLTCEKGYRFPWRLCASPLFRKWIFDFFESGASPEKIVDSCNRLGYACIYRKKLDKK